MTADLANHLWQSTAFAIAAWLLTLVLRRNRAQVRYWLWLSASLKFLVPFSLLMSAGRHLEWASAIHKIAPATPAITSAMLQMDQPFSDGLPLMPATADPRDWIVSVIIGLWACGFLAIVLLRVRAWNRIRAAVASSTAIGTHAGMEVRSLPGFRGPGVVGFFRPILLMPADITGRLRPSQLEAVLAHEFCHVRRHDNLTSALHMIVEAIFWFHPLVWWIGSRLVEERERACDEAVLISGATPHDYVQGILAVCKSYLETPLSCVSGITGSNLKRRIQLILARRLPKNLSFAKKLALAGSGTVALLIPVALGTIGTPLIEAQSQSAAPKIALQSLELKPGRRPAPGFPNRASSGMRPGYFEIGNASLRDLIRVAYRLRNFQVIGGPAWVDSHDYEVIARASGKPPIKSWMRALGPIFQTLLQDRFDLKWHYEKRKLPVYLLTVARGGNKLRRSSEENCGSFFFTTYPKRMPAQGCGAVAAVNMQLNMQLNAVGMKIDPRLVNFLSGRVRRPVIDETGLTGRYDFEFEWNVAATRKALGEPGPAPNPDSPTIFTALEHQLGLKLESSKRPTEVLIVDHAERPKLAQLSAR